MECHSYDIARNLVAAGNAHARALGLDKLEFHEGDASALTGISDHAFDLTLTVFGAEFRAATLRRREGVPADRVAMVKDTCSARTSSRNS